MELIDEFTKYIVAKHLGDLASVAGIGISIVGFVATLWNVARSRTAAEQAREAVTRVRKAFAKVDIITEFATVMAMVDRIKQLQRVEQWKDVHDHYASVIKSLRAIHGAPELLSKSDKIALRVLIQQFRGLEDKIELSIAGEGKPLQPGQLNIVLSKQADKLNRIHDRLRPLLRDEHGTE